MFPISDQNPAHNTPITVGIVVALNVLVWIFIQGLGTKEFLLESFCSLALIPAELLGHIGDGESIPFGESARCVLENRMSWLTPLSSMFMHGGWMHIVGNLWFLWVFGDNVEDVTGPVRFAAFYLICGFAAAAAQIAAGPESAVPMVGASGAIGGVMGAYARLYPKARIKTFVFLGIIFTTMMIPAYLMLGYWFFIQLVSGVPTLLATKAGGGVAFWAHAGGFAAGFFLIQLFSRRPVAWPTGFADG